MPPGHRIKHFTENCQHDCVVLTPLENHGSIMTMQHPSPCSGQVTSGTKHIGNTTCGHIVIKHNTTNQGTEAFLNTEAYRIHDVSYLVPQKYNQECLCLLCRFVEALSHVTQLR